MKVYKINLNIEPAVSGEWAVEKFIVDENAAWQFNLRANFNKFKRGFIIAGEYYKLTHRGNVVMSNTPDEIIDHYDFIERANGKVLIAGLGLGMVVKALLEKPEVTKIVVIEKSEDVISLTAKYYLTDSRVTIIHADIFEYTPEENFDFAWFDIWNDICTDNLSEMQLLHKKFKKNCSNVDSWTFKLLRKWAE